VIGQAGQDQLFVRPTDVGVGDLDAIYGFNTAEDFLGVPIASQGNITITTFQPGTYVAFNVGTGLWQGYLEGVNPAQLAGRMLYWFREPARALRRGRALP
jgi:hypothetical protein